jgi:hypothetical protein
VSGRDRHNFVGYASSPALRDAFLATRDDYRAAHKRAVRISTKLSLASAFHEVGRRGGLMTQGAL